MKKMLFSLGSYKSAREKGDALARVPHYARMQMGEGAPGKVN
jgi:hypothetical protein